MVGKTPPPGSGPDGGVRPYRGAEPPPGENSGFFHFYAHFSRAAASRHAPRKRRFMCQRVSAVERPRERLPCRPPGRLRAGAPLQPASWPHRLSSLLSKLFPFIRAAAVGRSRPAESSTSLFDRLGVMSSTGTSQVSSAPSHPSPRSGAFRKKIAAFGPAAFSRPRPPTCRQVGEGGARLTRRTGAHETVSAL